MINIFKLVSRLVLGFNQPYLSYPNELSDLENGDSDVDMEDVDEFNTSNVLQEEEEEEEEEEDFGHAELSILKSIDTEKVSPDIASWQEFFSDVFPEPLEVNFSLSFKFNDPKSTWSRPDKSKETDHSTQLPEKSFWPLHLHVTGYHSSYPWSIAVAIKGQDTFTILNRDSEWTRISFDLLQPSPDRIAIKRTNLGRAIAGLDLNSIKGMQTSQLDENEEEIGKEEENDTVRIVRSIPSSFLILSSYVPGGEHIVSECIAQHGNNYYTLPNSFWKKLLQDAPKQLKTFDKTERLLERLRFNLIRPPGLSEVSRKCKLEINLKLVYCLKETPAIP